MSDEKIETKEIKGPLASLQLGTRVRDRVTGQTGIVTGYAEYLHQVPIYRVEGTSGNGGAWEDWVPAERLKINPGAR